MAAPGKPGAAFFWDFRDSRPMDAGSVRGIGVAFQTVPDRCPKSRMRIICMTEAGQERTATRRRDVAPSHRRGYNHGNGASPF